MSLTPEEVAKIAHLARLTLSPKEVASYTHQLSKILTFVASIQDAATDEIPPLLHPLEHLTQRMREDVVTEKDNHESFLALAPLTKASLYLVPKVIE